MFKLRTLLAMFALAAITAAGVATANAGSTDATTTDASPSASSLTSNTTAVASVQTAIKDHFALFRDAPATPMPASIAQQIGSPSRFGRNPDLARTIDTPYGTAWVIPGDGYMCIAVPDPVDGYGESCVPTDVAVTFGLWVRLQRGDDSTAEALDTIVTPDGTQVAPLAGRATTNAGPGAVSRMDVGADTRPTLVAG